MRPFRLPFSLDRSTRSSSVFAQSLQLMGENVWKGQVYGHLAMSQEHRERKVLVSILNGVGEECPSKLWSQEHDQGASALPS